MATPLKNSNWKRSINAFQSTHTPAEYKKSFGGNHLLTNSFFTKPKILNDRTIFKRNLEPVQEQWSYRESTKQLADSNDKTAEPQNFQETTSFVSSISKQIAVDNELSQKDSARHFQKHHYLPIHRYLRVASSPVYELPSLVTEQYSKCELQRMPDRVNFCQGHLIKSGLLYYAVQRTVLFYDIRKIIQGVSPDDAFINQMAMEDILHSITEISLPSALVGKNMQNNIMVFVHPWLLVFYAYVLAEKVEGTARVLTLNDIRVRFNLHCQIATHFYSTVNGTIYYLDEQGTVNRLSMEQRGFVMRLATRSLYALHNTRCKLGLMQLSKGNRKTSYNRIAYYCSVVHDSIKSLFYSRKHVNHSLICDEQRKMLFTLTESSFEQDRLSGRQFKSNKLIRAYSCSQNHLDLICVVSAQDLIETMTIYNCVQGRNHQIQSIAPISKSFNSESNLIVLLASGIRLYVYVSSARVELNVEYMPPDLSVILNSEQLPKWTHSDTEVKVFAQHPKENINPIATCITQSSLFHVYNCLDSQLKTFLIYKDNESTQAENYISFKWNGGPQPPVDNFLSHFREEAAKFPRKLLHDSKVFELHEMAKQVYYEPQVYFYTTHNFVQHRSLLRPIDILLTAIQASNNHTLSRAITQIFPKSSLKDIIVMLIQLHCDQAGRYKSSNILRAKFADYLNKFGSKKKSMMLSFNHYLNMTEGRNESDEAQMVTVVEYRELSEQTISSFLKLIDEISMDPQNYEPQLFAEGKNRGTEGKSSRNSFLLPSSTLPRQINVILTPRERILSASQNLKRDSLLAYISRLVRVVWTESLPHIGEDASHISQKLEPLKDVLSFMIHDIALRSQFKGLLNKIVQLLMMTKYVPQLPQILFHQGLLSTPEIFQEGMFIWLMHKSNDPADIVTKWQSIFPLFVTQQLMRVVKISKEIQEVKEAEQILNILDHHEHIPHYLAQHISQQNDFGGYVSHWVQKQKRFQEARKMLPWWQSPKHFAASKSKTGKGQKLFPRSEYLSNAQKLLEKIQEQPAKLEQKRLYLQAAESNLRMARESNNKHQIYIRLNQLKNRLVTSLHLQKLLYEKYRFMPDKDQEIQSILENCTLAHEHIKSAVMEIKDAEVEAICVAMFGANDREIELALTRSLKEAAHKGLPSQAGKNMQESIRYLITNSRSTIRATNILSAFETCQECQIVSYADLKRQFITLKSNSRHKCSIFLIGPFLVELNSICLEEVKDYYYRKFNAKLLSDYAVTFQEKLLYNWLNYRQIVWDYCHEDSTLFSRQTQIFLRDARDNRLIQQELEQALQQICKEVVLSCAK